MAQITGGKKFEKALREIAAGVSKPATLRVGFLEGAKYPDGTPVAMIAAIHNYGAPRAGIPPRPFFDNLIADKKGEWPGAIADLLKANGYDAAKALDLAGEGIAGQLRQEIAEGDFAPLKPATIARKGFDKPLVETGHMLNSVDHEVATA